MLSAELLIGKKHCLIRSNYIYYIRYLSTMVSFERAKSNIYRYVQNLGNFDQELKSSFNIIKIESDLHEYKQYFE